MNWFKKWREAKRKKEAARQFDAGFLSACKQVLLEGRSPSVDFVFMYNGDASWDYEDGVRMAISKLAKLLHNQPGTTGKLQ
jgi:hypothetical protein